MLRRVLSLLACTLWGNCHIVCLGDSNTAWVVPGSPVMWCEMLAERLRGTGWEVKNRGQSGMTAGVIRDRHGHELVSGLTGEPSYAGFHLERLLAEDRLDVLLIALGTNDVLGQHSPPQVLNDILALKTRAEQARPGLRVLVALVPPQFVDRSLEPNLVVTNAVLQQSLRPAQILDFFTGMTRDDIVGLGVHLSGAAHQKRADVAYRALGFE